MQDSTIEWTNKTWNPVTGCTKVSQGCKNCYAERIYERFHGHGSFKNVITHEEKLYDPIKWKQPAKIFVNSMSDLFHEDVPFDFIDMVFAIMGLCPQHTFQVLTKRSERMVEYFKSRADMAEIEEAAEIIVYTNPHLFFQKEHYNVEGKKSFIISNELQPHLKTAGWYSGTTYVEFGDGDYGKDSEFIYEGEYPFPNVWMGVSVENNEQAQRMQHLAEIDAAVKFLSCEPLLGPITLPVDSNDGSGFFDWIIVGGESGPGSRPMHPDWARSLRDQSKHTGAAFFFKQWGEYLPKCQTDSFIPDLPLAKTERKFQSPHNPNKLNTYYRLGKKKAGSILDGIEHKEFP